jgi:endonuclease YncB( thermonuclease family)
LSSTASPDPARQAHRCQHLKTVAPDEPIGCFGKQASNNTKKMLADRLVRQEIPRISNSEDAYGRTPAYVYLDANDNGHYEHLYNEHLLSSWD